MNDFYYATPNKMIPLNDREPGEIAPIALQQLKRFQLVSLTWPIYQMFRDGRYQKICRICNECLWFIKDTNNVEYKYSQEEIQTLIVAHVRQCHADRVGEKGELLDESPGKPQVLDHNGRPYSDGFDSGNAYRPDYKGSDSGRIECA